MYQSPRLPHTLMISVIVLAVGVSLSFVGCGGHYVDYIDFIHFNNVDYIHQSAYPPLQPQLIGPQYATIKQKLQDNVNDANYKHQDGDAAFLTPGTRIYTIQGYRPTFRLAVTNTQNSSGGYIYYEAKASSQDKTAGDWLDIKGKVASIGIQRDYPETSQIGIIQDPTQIKDLVKMLLTTSFSSEKSTDNSSFEVLAFHLQDGTTTLLPFYPQVNAFTPTLRVSQTFTNIIQSAITS